MSQDLRIFFFYIILMMKSKFLYFTFLLGLFLINSCQAVSPVNEVESNDRVVDLKLLKGAWVSSNFKGQLIKSNCLTSTLEVFTDFVEIDCFGDSKLYFSYSNSMEPLYYSFNDKIEVIDENGKVKFVILSLKNETLVIKDSKGKSFEFYKASDFNANDVKYLSFGKGEEALKYEWLFGEYDYCFEDTCERLIFNNEGNIIGTDFLYYTVYSFDEKDIIQFVTQDDFIQYYELRYLKGEKQFELRQVKEIEDMDAALEYTGVVKQLSLILN
jgi:hypothetical protein